MQHVNQRTIFQEIRHYLAGRVLGVTRDPALLDEVMKLLVARKSMLRNGGLPTNIEDLQLSKHYRSHFGKSNAKLNFEDEILLDPTSIRFVHDKMVEIDLLSPNGDPVGDLYETFIGSSIRGSEGQFFTPENAASWLVDAVAPTSNERIIDPACGAGGFLVLASQYARGCKHLYGIEKDDYLVKLARARSAVLGMDTTLVCVSDISTNWTECMT